MVENARKTPHYPQPVVNDWSIHRYEKLEFEILIQGSFITDNEFNDALSSSFVSSSFFLDKE